MIDNRRRSRITVGPASVRQLPAQHRTTRRRKGAWLGARARRDTIAGQVHWGGSPP